MRASLPATLLGRLSDFVARQTGLHFPKERWCDLERGLRNAAQAFGIGDAAACAQWLLSAPPSKAQIETLASHLTIGETYFFRDQTMFALLQEHILPELIRRRRSTERQLRIWSAGCCTGEEPYSVAIMLHQLLADWQDWRVALLATDINPGFLHKAAQGVYGEWSFRTVPAQIRARYFQRVEAARFEILAQLRQSVTFALLNLATDLYPSHHNNTDAMDVIFCRNVLMYFTPEQAKRVVQNLYHSLADGGWLIVSPCEAAGALFAQFATVTFPGAILYQKNTHSSQSAKEHSLNLASVYPSPVELWQPLSRLSDAALAFPPGDGLASLHQEPWALHRTDQWPDPANSPLLPVSYPAKTVPSPAVQHSEAVALYEQGHYTEAEGRALRLLAHNPQDGEAVALLALIYANQRRLTEAQQWCERAIAADRLDAGSYYLRATIQEEQGQIEDAAKSLKQALYIDPTFVLAHFALGSLALRQRKFAQADKHFANTLALLGGYGREDLLPGSNRLTAGELRQIISPMAHAEKWP
jgi:chemotaxis protein methyltransferase CheR